MNSLNTKKMGFTHDSVDNQTQEWLTPPWIFQALGLEFMLDPCFPLFGAEWIPALKHYTIEDDGLTQPWYGKVWLNPPYGTKTATWLERMHLHGDGVALVFARTDCKWFKDCAEKANAFLFLQKRIKFVDLYGKTAGNGAGAGSMLIAWGRDNVAALKQMRQHGVYFDLRIDAAIAQEKK